MEAYILKQGRRINKKNAEGKKGFRQREKH